MLPTFPLLVAVAVTWLLVALPVVKPSAKVPLKVPFVTALGLAADTASEDIPDFKLENAAASSEFVVEPVDVKVNPLSVKT